MTQVQTRAKPASALTATTPSGAGLLQRKCACGGSAGLTGECAECEKEKLLGTTGPRLQKKLAISEPGDQYEQEADRLAEQVIRLPGLKVNEDTPVPPESPLVQRRVLGDTAGLTAAPPIVHEVLSSPGQPLDLATRAYFEPRFGHDFSRVRVHWDERAAESARFINALAYTLGAHIVFGSGQYAPQTTGGRQLMAHELTHVAQAGATAPRSKRVGDSRDEREVNGQQAFSPVDSRQVHQLGADGAPLVRRREDPRLQEFLENLRMLGANTVGPYGTEGLVEQIFELLHGVDLSDPDNFAPISQVVAEAFPDSVLLQFLTHMEDRARKGRIGELPSRHPLGKGAYGLFPVTTLTIGAFGQLAQSFIRSSQAFLEGLYGGLTQAKFSEAELQALKSNLMASTVLNVVFPSVFLRGVLVGIGRDAKNVITGAIDVIGNFSAVVDQFGELVHEFLVDPELARTLGEETGNHFVEEIRKLAGLDPIRFTYELGQLIGPPVVYTVLSLLGFPALAGAIIFGKLSAALAQFPRVARILEFVAKRLRAGADSQILAKLLQGSGLSERPPSASLTKAREALKAGTTTIEDYEVLLREAVRDARDFIQASPARYRQPIHQQLTWEVMGGACGKGRDCSVASFAGMAYMSLKPISIARFQAYRVFGKDFHNHAFSVVTFPDGQKYLVDPTFAQFQESLLSADERAFAIDLVRDGFIPLDDANGAIYTTILHRAGSRMPGAGSPEAPPLAKTDATSLAQKLRNGLDAEITETVGAGEEGVMYTRPRGSDIEIVTREELLKYAAEIRIGLRAIGDPHNLEESMKWVINRIENGTEAIEDE